MPNQMPQNADPSITAPASQLPSDFSDLIERCRQHEEALAAIGREATALVARSEQEARDVAERLLTAARIEAARMLTEARREVSLLSAQVESLRRAQREAALALQQTRRALDGALGMAGVRESSPPTLAAIERGTYATRTAPETPRPGPRAVPGRPRSQTTLQVPRAWMAGAAAVVVVSLLAAVTLWLFQARASKAAGLGVSAVQAADARVEDDASADSTAPMGRLKAAPTKKSTAATSSTAASARSAAAPPETSAASTGRSAGPTRTAEGRLKAAPTTTTAITAKSTAASARNSVAATKSTAASTSDVAAARTGRLKAAPTAAATSGIAGTSPEVGTPVVVTPPPASPSLEQQILAADRAWFNAFYRNDQASLTRLNAPGFALSDARAANRKAPAGSSPQRELRNVRVDVHGDGAVLSGRMIERITRGGATEQHESFVSEVWIRREGEWKLLGLRLASPEQVQEAAGPLSTR